MARALNFGCRPRAQILEPTSQHPLEQNSWPRLYHLQIGSSSRSNFIPLYVHPPLAYRPTPVSIGSPRKKGIIPDSPFSCNRVSLAENLLHPGGTLEHPIEELVNRYERKIFRLGMNITQNREDAEDVMQDAFLKSYQNLDRFQGDSRFYTWLVRIAVNEALMKLRKRRPNQVSLDEPLTQAEDPVFREIEDWGPSPEQRFAQTELNEILTQVIGDLDPIFRVVFTLRDVEGISTDETAHILGISVAAVKSRLLRARLKLRQKLNKYFRRSESQ